MEHCGLLFQAALQSMTIFTTTSMLPSPIPGFPIESILAGLLGGLIALTMIQGRRRLQLPSAPEGSDC